MNAPPHEFVPADSGQPTRVDLAEAAPAAIQIDFQRVFAAIYRNRYFIITILAVCAALGVMATMATTPIYRAMATIQIDTQSSNVLGKDNVEEASTNYYDLDRFLQTNLDVLKSHSLALRVVNALNLAGNDEFFRRMGMDAPTAASPGMTMAETRRELIAHIIESSVKADLPRNSQVVEINFDSPDPAYAMKIANSYAENFIAANLQRKFDSSAYARNYLEEQLKLAKERVEASEKAQNAYARDKGLIDVITETGSGDSRNSTSLLLTNLVTANAALNSARNERVHAEERYRVAAAGNPMSIPEVQSNGAIQQLLRERAVAWSELSRDRERYEDGHPTIRQRQQQLQSLDQQINRFANQVRDSLRQQFDAARANEAKIESQVASLRSGNQIEQDERVQYNILAREASTNRTLYDGLLQRYREVSASAGVAANNISLVDRAQMPRGPIQPRPKRNLALALIIGVAISAIFVMLREFYDDAIRTPDDINRKLQIPFIGIVPKLPPGVTAAEALADPKSSVSEAFAALRTSMGLLSTKGRLRTLMVTSSRESEGKSMVAFGIARTFARLGNRVLVVDADLRRPSQHRLFETSREIGLTNVLSRQMTWQEARQKTEVAEVDFLASGPLPPSVPELLSGGSFQSLLEELADAYDLVMFDSPPVLGLADAILLGNMVDHLIYVIEAGRPLRGRGLAAVRRLRAAGVKIDGTVLNKFDPKHAGYGYEYGYYYYYGKDDK